DDAVLGADRGGLVRNRLRGRVGLRGSVVLGDELFLIPAAEPSAVPRCKRHHYDEETDNDEACIFLEPAHGGAHTLLIGAATRPARSTRHRNNATASKY